MKTFNRILGWIFLAIALIIISSSFRSFGFIDAIFFLPATLIITSIPILGAVLGLKYPEKKYTTALVALLLLFGFIILTSIGRNNGGKSYGAAIQGAISATRATAEIYWTENGNSYANVCASERMISLANATLKKSKKITLPISSVVCNDSKEAWAISAPSAEEGKYYCADSLGNATTTKRSLRVGETACI